MTIDQCIPLPLLTYTWKCLFQGPAEVVTVIMSVSRDILNKYQNIWGGGALTKFCSSLTHTKRIGHQLYKKRCRKLSVKKSQPWRWFVIKYLIFTN